MGLGNFKRLISQLGRSVAKKAPKAVAKKASSSSGDMNPLKKVSTAMASALPKGSKLDTSSPENKEENVKNLMKAMRKVGRFKMFKEGGAVKKPVKRAAGSPPKGETTYEVLGRRVTKEQYDKASKEMDRPKSKVEEDMDDFAKQARERAKMKPKKMMSGGMADKAGRAMKKTAADAKGRAMTKAPKKMMGGGMAKYAKGGSVACGPATRGYGAARKSK